MNWKLPNQLTVARLVLSVVFFFLLAGVNLDRPWAAGMLLAAFIVYVVAGITDVLDGWLARRWKVTSVFGRLADPIVDKVMVCGGFVLLTGANFAFPGGTAPDAFERSLGWLHGGMASAVQAWMVVVIIAREFVISGIRGYSESQGLHFGATPAGKIKMFIQSLALCMILFQLAFWRHEPWAIVLKIALVWLTVIVTLGSGLMYVGKARGVLRSTEGSERT